MGGNEARPIRGVKFCTIGCRRDALIVFEGRESIAPECIGCAVNRQPFSDTSRKPALHSQCGSNIVSGWALKRD